MLDVFKLSVINIIVKVQYWLGYVIKGQGLWCVCGDRRRQKSPGTSKYSVNVFTFIFYIWISSVWKPGHVSSFQTHPLTRLPNLEQSIRSPVCPTIKKTLTSSPQSLDQTWKKPQKNNLLMASTHCHVHGEDELMSCPLCKPFLHWRKLKCLKILFWNHLWCPDSQRQKRLKKQQQKKQRIRIKKAW